MTQPSFTRHAQAILLACACFVCAAGWTGAQDNVNPIGMSMTRSHVGEYMPGEEILIQVSFAAENTSRPLNALGLRETVPPGWMYVGATGVTGNPPSVQPAQGQQGLLEFAWIEVPSLPYSFNYTVKVPDDDPGGTQLLQGQLEYRLAGNARYAPPLLTTLIGIAPGTEPDACIVKSWLGCGMRPGRESSTSNALLGAFTFLGLMVLSVSQRRGADDRHE